jgi:hypothetical protein
MALLSKSELRTLLEHQDGWCVSIYMPTHRAGPDIQQDPIRLKNLLSEAEERLTEAGVRAAEARALLAPAQELADLSVFWRHQADGLAMFLSPTFFRVYRLPIDFEELAVVAPRFHVKPLLALLTTDGRFYILALSQNEVRLLQGTRYSVSQVDLQSVPASLEEAIRWDDPERRLQWHSQTGNRADTVRAAIFHGHGVASADDPKDYIKRYSRQIDQGLGEVLHSEHAPLVLAGVDYILPIYREANTYGYVTERAVEGNPETLSAEELHEEAWSIVEPIFDTERAEAAARYEELAGKGSELASDRVEEIVVAAYHGRVDTLFAATTVQVWGTADPEAAEVYAHKTMKPGDEDLLNVAAIQTLVNDGRVYAVDAEEVPGGAPFAAIFRY